MKTFYQLFVAVFVTFLLVQMGYAQTPKINEAYSRGVTGNLDWVEIYNPSASSIDISGYKIYDSGGQAGTKSKKLFPVGTILSAKGFYVIITDTIDFAGDDSGFGLSSGGETVWLEDASGILIDSMVIPALGIDTSFARLPNGSDFLNKTTPLTRGYTNVFNWYLFDDPSNLTAAVPGYGPDLVLTGAQLAVAGPNAENGAVSMGIGSYYTLTHSFLPNGGGTKVNEYTLMFDFKVDQALGMWHNFFQTDPVVNANDGEYFIRSTTGALGTLDLGYTTPFVVSANTWYRLILSVDNGNFFKAYIDGQFVFDHNIRPVDDLRYSLASVLHFLGDDDGDDGKIEIAEIAMWGNALSEQQILALGSAGTFIPVEFSSFTAEQSLGIVTLLWSTATELNNKGFEIERKSQEDNWQVLGFVKGIGTTTTSHNYSFVDKPENSAKYSYRLKQIDFDGTFTYSDAIEVILRPTEFMLHDNYPNPFNPSTIISYELPTDAFVSLKVYNSNGELVAELVNEYQISGRYNQTFSISSQNRVLSSGVYFAELKANQMVQRIKMMLLK